MKVVGLANPLHEGAAGRIMVWFSADLSADCL